MAIPETYRTPHGLSDRLRAEVLATSRLVLGTINPDGTPHMTLVLFSMEGDELFVPTPHSTRKIRNLRERTAVTTLIPVASGWVSCYGEAEVVEGERAQVLNQGVRKRLLTDEGLATMGRFLEAHEDTTIHIRPTRWLSWIGDVIDPWMEERGIDLSAQDTWWKDLSADPT